MNFVSIYIVVIDHKDGGREIDSVWSTNKLARERVEEINRMEGAHCKAFYELQYLDEPIN